MLKAKGQTKELEEEVERLRRRLDGEKQKKERFAEEMGVRIRGMRDGQENWIGGAEYGNGVGGYAVTDYNKYGNDGFTTEYKPPSYDYKNVLADLRSANLNVY